MAAMGIREDFQTYIDQNGLVQPKPGDTSGNGLLFTAQYVMALLAARKLNLEDKNKIAAAFKRCIQEQPGLMSRSPRGQWHSEEQEGPDDYIGVGAASYFLGLDLAAAILRYGREHGATGWSELEELPRVKLSRFVYFVLSLGGLRGVKYVYNNVDPGKFSLQGWLGRQQNLICHLQFAANKVPNIWRKLWWCLAILQSARAERANHDVWVLGWLCVRTMDGRSSLCSLFARYWEKRFREKYPDGVGQLLGDYFVNPQHPLAVWLKGVF